MRQAPGNALASSAVRARTLGYCYPYPYTARDPLPLTDRTLGYCGPVRVGLDPAAQVGVGEHIEAREWHALCFQDLVRGTGWGRGRGRGGPSVLSSGLGSGFGLGSVLLEGRARVPMTTNPNPNPNPNLSSA